MQEERSRCQKCGGAVDADGQCAACLLELAAGTDTGAESGGVPENAQRGKIPELEIVRRAFPHLEILECIGRGGMGTVFKARQPKLDRFVALKILSEELAAQPEFAARFAQEGKLLARLNHPNIVAVYDFGQAATADEAGKETVFFYLLMEYVDGANLRQVMREQRLSPSQAVAVIPQICEALEYAHAEGVLHRDVKPENILLDVKGRVKIADFGIAAVMWDVAGEESVADGAVSSSAADVERLTHTGRVLGTPSYMAPEQVDAAGAVDQRADVYSLGVVFYEMLTGELPRGAFPPPSKKTPIPAEIDGIVMRALEKNRDQRYDSVAEMKTELETVKRGMKKDTALPETSADAPPISMKKTLATVVLMLMIMPFAAILLTYIIDLLTGREEWLNGGYDLGDILFNLAGVGILGAAIWYVWFRAGHPEESPDEAGTKKKPGGYDPVTDESSFLMRYDREFESIIVGMIVPYVAALAGSKTFESDFLFANIKTLLQFCVPQLLAMLFTVMVFQLAKSMPGLLRYMPMGFAFGAMGLFYFLYGTPVTASWIAFAVVLCIPVLTAFIGLWSAMIVLGFRKLNAEWAASRKPSELKKKRFRGEIWAMCIGFAVPIVAQWLGSLAYHSEFHCMYAPPALIFSLSINAILVLPTVFLFWASRSFTGILRYVTVLAGYGRFFSLHFWYMGVPLDPQSGIALVFFPFYSVFYAIVGYVAASVANSCLRAWQEDEGTNHAK